MHINHATALYLHSINIHKHIIKYITKKIPHVLINAYYFFRICRRERTMIRTKLTLYALRQITYAY